MKAKIFFMFLFLFSISYAQTGERLLPKVLMNVNGHEHALPDSLFNEIDSLWTANTNNIENEIRQNPDRHFSTLVNFGVNKIC